MAPCPKGVFFSVSVCHTTVSQFVFHTSLVKLLSALWDCPVYLMLSKMVDNICSQFDPALWHVRGNIWWANTSLVELFSVVFTHSMIPFSSHKYPMTCSPDIYFCKFTLAGRNSTMKQL